MKLNPFSYFPRLNLFGPAPRFKTSANARTALQERNIRPEWDSGFQYAGQAGLTDPARPKPGSRTPSVPSSIEHVRSLDEHANPMHDPSPTQENITGQLTSG